MFCTTLALYTYVGVDNQLSILSLRHISHAYVHVCHQTVQTQSVHVIVQYTNTAVLESLCRLLTEYLN